MGLVHISTIIHCLNRSGSSSNFVLLCTVDKSYIANSLGSAQLKPYIHGGKFGPGPWDREETFPTKVNFLFTATWTSNIGGLDHILVKFMKCIDVWISLYPSIQSPRVSLRPAPYGWRCGTATCSGGMTSWAKWPYPLITTPLTIIVHSGTNYRKGYVFVICYTSPLF